MIKGRLARPPLLNEVRLNKCWTGFGVVAMIAALSGCAGDTLWTSARSGFIHHFADRPVLNDRFQFVRMTYKDIPFYFVLANQSFIDIHIQQEWWSQDYEVIKTVDGRIIETHGLPIDWSQGYFTNLPAWNDESERRSFLRVRQVMPDYQTISESVTVHQITAPSKSQLIGYKPKDLVWFEERVESTSRNLNQGDQTKLIPANRYALLKTSNGAQLIYSEQWLSPTYCLTLQPITAAQKKLIEQGHLLFDVDAQKTIP
jgi:Group 4 capsule polysaccharide lipoprotein gfcB, YjbF